MIDPGRNFHSPMSDSQDNSDYVYLQSPSFIPSLSSFDSVELESSFEHLSNESNSQLPHIKMPCVSAVHESEKKEPEGTWVKFAQAVSWQGKTGNDEPPEAAAEQLEDSIENGQLTTLGVNASEQPTVLTELRSISSEIKVDNQTQKISVGTQTDFGMTSRSSKVIFSNQNTSICDSCFRSAFDPGTSELRTPNEIEIIQTGLALTPSKNLCGNSVSSSAASVKEMSFNECEPLLVPKSDLIRPSAASANAQKLSCSEREALPDPKCDSASRSEPSTPEIDALNGKMREFISFLIVSYIPNLSSSLKALSIRSI